MAADLSRAGIAILGCGAVGRALAVQLLDVPNRSFRGRITVWSRTRANVTTWLAQRTRSERRRLSEASRLDDAVAGQGIVLLCVADQALPSVSRALAQRPPPGRTRPAVLVTSGSFPLARLAFLRAKGYALGRLHPLAPFRREFSGTELCYSPFAVEGDARALRAASTVARWLKGEILPLVGTARAAQAYHAGAALLGGGVAALMELAERTMAPSVRVEPFELRGSLHTFVHHVTLLTWLHGPRDALTGPLSRGSDAVVRENLRALRRVPRAAEAYQELGLTMLTLARERGSIDAATERRLRKLLARRKR